MTASVWVDHPEAARAYCGDFARAGGLGSYFVLHVRLQHQTQTAQTFVRAALR